jgi:ApaG protein
MISRAMVDRMFCEFRELTGLTVTVDKVVYMPNLEAPPDRPYPFVYYITIHNESDEVVTIKGRKWVVTDEDATCVVVEGDGVVGKFPRLEPGDEFSYHSYHTIGSDSVAEGSFFGVSEDGSPVIARIPKFKMKLSECC